MASGDGATSVRILNENVDKLTKLPDMVKAFEELTNEEVIVTVVVVCNLCMYHRLCTMRDFNFRWAKPLSTFA